MDIITSCSAPNFNPLPRKEGDRYHGQSCRDPRNFNPLPRKEGDQSDSALPNHVTISIHSLVKRETENGGNVLFLVHHFNPLPRKEGDKNAVS